MATPNNRLMNLKSVQAISNTRKRISSAHVGRTVSFTITGDGNVVDVKKKDGTYAESYLGGGQVFQKKIFNLDVVSDEAVNRMRQTLVDAIKAEKAGDAAKADELFRLWLNKTQVSFNLPLPSALEDELSKGTDISAKVVEITTENGSFLTIDPKTIKVQKPEIADAFKLVIDIDDEEEDNEPADELAGMDRAAMVALNKAKGFGIKSKGMSDDDLRAALKEAMTPKTVSSALDEDDEF